MTSVLQSVNGMGTYESLRTRVQKAPLISPSACMQPKAHAAKERETDAHKVNVHSHVLVLKQSNTACNA